MERYTSPPGTPNRYPFYGYPPNQRPNSRRQLRYYESPERLRYRREDEIVREMFRARPELPRWEQRRRFLVWAHRYARYVGPAAYQVYKKYRTRAAIAGGMYATYRKAQKSWNTYWGTPEHEKAYAFPRNARTGRSCDYVQARSGTLGVKWKRQKGYSTKHENDQVYGKGNWRC